MIIFPCHTVFVLHVFPGGPFSCCILPYCASFILPSIHVAIFRYYTFSVKFSFHFPRFHVEFLWSCILSCCNFTCYIIFYVRLFSCYIFLMLQHFHVEFFNVTLISCYNFYKLHSFIFQFFYVALTLVIFFLVAFCKIIYK